MSQRTIKTINGKPIALDKEQLDKAVNLLIRYDPDWHHPEDYVLAIASACIGAQLPPRSKFMRP